MSVSPVGPGYPVTRLQGSTAVGRPGGSTDVSPTSQDTVEISDSARYLSALKNLPDVRQDKVDAARSQIADGTYETPDKLNTTVDRLYDDL